MSHPSSTTSVECLRHLHHFTFVDCTIIALHYLKKINIIDYESIEKAYNKLNSKQMEPQISNFTWSALHIGMLTHPHLWTITSTFPVFFLRFLFHTQQMKPRPNYKEREKKRKTSTTNPINETKTKLQKKREKKVKQRKTITTQSMAMLKLNKTKHANKNKKKCKHPLCTSPLL